MSNVKAMWIVLLVATLVTPVFAGGSREESSDDLMELDIVHNMLVETEGGAAVAFRGAVERVQAAYPNLVISEEALAAAAYHTKIKTMAAGGEVPDVFIIRGSMLDTLIENDLVQPIDADLDADPQWRGGFLPGVFDVFTRGDNVYGVPLSAKATSLVFYNRNIFDEVGIEHFPSTAEEFVDAVTRLRDAGYTPIALGNQDKWVVNSCILSTLGDRFTGTDWFWDIKSGDGAAFTDQPFVDSLEVLQSLAEMGAFNSDMNSIDNMQMKTLYYQEEAAMFIEGAWAIGSVASDAPEHVREATALAVLPDFDGHGDPGTFSGGASLAYVMNGELTGERREIALQLLKELSGPEYGAHMAESNKFPAVTPGPFDESQLSDLTLEYNALVEETSFTPVYDIHLTPPVIEVMNVAAQELLIGLITPEEMASRIQEEYELEY